MKPFPTIGGEPEARERVATHLTRHAEPFKTLAKLIEERPYDDQHRPCICLCNVEDGSLRKRITQRVIFPLQRAVAQQVTGYRLTVQAHLPQAVGDNVDIGPDVTIGLTRTSRGLIGNPDASCSIALKMWLWNDEGFLEPPYLPEEQAEVELWQLARQRCAAGLTYLQGMGTAPTQPQLYPLQVAGDLHTLLGVDALRNLVHRHLGLNLVLIDANRLISASHLRWEHYSPWAA